MRIQLDKKAKIVDVLIIGDGSYARIIADILLSAKKAVHVVSDSIAGSVRCIKPGVYTVDSQRYSAKSVVILVRPKTSIPELAGLDKTPFVMSARELTKTIKGPGSVIIAMTSASALIDALELSERGFLVDVVSTDQRPLALFDPSVSDYMKRILKLAKVRFVESATALNAIKTAKGIYLVTEQNGIPKRLKADYLIVQPHTDDFVDLGLSNAGVRSLFAGIAHQEVAYKHYGHVTYVNPQTYLTLNDLGLIAKQIGSRLTLRKNIKHVPVHLFARAGVDFVSVGVNESTLVSTHTAYSKAFVVIKDPETGKQAGFIKLLTHYTGKLVGVSCVHSGANEFVPLWVDTIRRRRHAKSILPLLVPNTPVAEAYLEALSEL